MTVKDRVLKGRAAIETYRAAHAQLCSKGWSKGCSEAHTPLLEMMLADLKVQGFNSLDDFFNMSNDLNAQELGFNGYADYRQEIGRLVKLPDKVKVKELSDKFSRMWH